MGTQIGIKRIEITNFRGIDHLELDFLNPNGEVSEIAVLAGPNGCGKTAVLEACLIALGCDDKLKGKQGNDAIRSGTDSYQIKAQISTGTGLFDVLIDSRNENVITADAESGEDVEIPITVSTDYYSSWRSPKLVGPLSIATVSGRDRFVSIPRDDESRIWRIKQRFINDEARAKWKQSLNGHRDKTSDLQKINDIWDQFYPGSSTRFIVEPLADDPDLRFDVFYLDKLGNRLSIDCLSSGQLELFAFFGGMIDSRNESGVIVIDEPELHLDPLWHTLMLRAIREFRPEVQLIVATHSPEVYDSVMSYQRFFLVPESDPRNKTWSKKMPEAVVA